MTGPLAFDTILLWVGVTFYIFALIAVAVDFFFEKPWFEAKGFFCAGIGMIPHGLAIIDRWIQVGHGPYIVRHEVLISNAWVIMAFFLISSRIFQPLRRAALVLFPTVFLLVALGMFSNAEMTKLPPTLRNVWLIFHVLFYKIALGAILTSFSLSILVLLKINGTLDGRLPCVEVLDGNAYRFTGFSFTFWGVGMLSGSIWAYQSWGRFWGWDPIETWSLLTWMCFGIQLHVRRFFGWKDSRAAYTLIICVLVSLIAVFFVPLIDTSIHSEYFK